MHERYLMLKKVFLAAAVVVAACTLSQAADYSKVPNPMKNAKVGQWVHYKIMGGMEQKQTISAIEGEGDDRIITIKADTIQGGNVLQSQEMKINLKDAKAQEEQNRQAAGDNVTITEEKITHNGKSYDAIVIEATANGMSSKVYMAEAIPVSGMIKTEVQGMGAMMELVDFGE